MLLISLIHLLSWVLCWLIMARSSYYRLSTLPPFSSCSSFFFASFPSPSLIFCLIHISQTRIAVQPSMHFWGVALHAKWLWQGSAIAKPINIPVPIYPYARPRASLAKIRNRQERRTEERWNEGQETGARNVNQVSADQWYLVYDDHLSLWSKSETFL